MKMKVKGAKAAAAVVAAKAKGGSRKRLSGRYTPLSPMPVASSTTSPSAPLCWSSCRKTRFGGVSISLQNTAQLSRDVRLYAWSGSSVSYSAVPVPDPESPPSVRRLPVPVMEVLSPIPLSSSSSSSFVDFDDVDFTFPPGFGFASGSGSGSGSGSLTDVDGFNLSEEDAERTFERAVLFSPAPRHRRFQSVNGHGPGPGAGSRSGSPSPLFLPGSAAVATMETCSSSSASSSVCCASRGGIVNLDPLVAGCRFLYVVKVRDRRRDLNTRVNCTYPLLCAGEVCCLKQLLSRVLSSSDDIVYVTCMTADRPGLCVFGDVLEMVDRSHLSRRSDRIIPCAFPGLESSDTYHEVRRLPGDGITDRAFFATFTLGACGELPTHCMGLPVDGHRVPYIRAVYERDAFAFSVGPRMGGDVFFDDDSRYIWYDRLHPWNPMTTHYI